MWGAQRPMIKRTLWASTHFVKSRRQEGLVRDKMSSKASWLTTRPPKFDLNNSFQHHVPTAQTLNRKFCIKKDEQLPFISLSATISLINPDVL